MIRQALLAMAAVLLIGSLALAVQSNRDILALASAMIALCVFIAVTYRGQQ